MRWVRPNLLVVERVQFLKPVMFNSATRYANIQYREAMSKKESFVYSVYCGLKSSGL